MAAVAAGFRAGEVAVEMQEARSRQMRSGEAALARAGIAEVEAGVDDDRLRPRREQRGELARADQRRQARRVMRRTHRPFVPLVELLHAVLHRALVRPQVVLAALEEGAPPGVHSQRDLVVFCAGFPVGGLLGLDELALEGVDVLGIVELDDVERLLRSLRNQRRDDEHVRIPLDHRRRVVGQPDRAVARHRIVEAALAVGEDGVVPLAIGGRAGLASSFFGAPVCTEYAGRTPSAGRRR